MHAPCDAAVTVQATALGTDQRATRRAPVELENATKAAADILGSSSKDLRFTPLSILGTDQKHDKKVLSAYHHAGEPEANRIHKIEPFSGCI